MKIALNLRLFSMKQEFKCIKKSIDEEVRIELNLCKCVKINLI